MPPSPAPDPFLPETSRKANALPPPELRGQADVDVNLGRIAADEQAEPITLVSSRSRDDGAVRELARFTDRVASITDPITHAGDFRYIVIHESHTRSGGLADLEASTPGGSGYHFVIGSGRGSGDGEIEASRLWTRQLPGSHLPSDAPISFQTQSIGICLIGDFATERPTDRQLEAMQALIRRLGEAYRIPPYRILKHNEVTARGHAGRCPGRFFDIEDVISRR